MYVCVHVHIDRHVYMYVVIKYNAVLEGRHQELGESVWSPHAPCFWVLALRQRLAGIHSCYVKKLARRHRNQRRTLYARNRLDYKVFSISAYSTDTLLVWFWVHYYVETEGRWHGLMGNHQKCLSEVS